MFPLRGGVFGLAVARSRELIHLRRELVGTSKFEVEFQAKQEGKVRTTYSLREHRHPAGLEGLGADDITKERKGELIGAVQAGRERYRLR